jgi:hypothetical protein
MGQKFLLLRARISLTYFIELTGEAFMPNLEAVTVSPQRSDAWSASNGQCCVRYQILVEAEPDSLCRLLNLFAMQYLIPQQVGVLRQDDMLLVDVQIDQLTWHRAQVIAEKMRSLINVDSVELEHMAQPHAASSPVSLAAG